jgi:hypothetical protein
VEMDEVRLCSLSGRRNTVRGHCRIRPSPCTPWERAFGTENAEYFGATVRDTIVVTIGPSLDLSPLGPSR